MGEAENIRYQEDDEYEEGCAYQCAHTVIPGRQSIHGGSHAGRFTFPQRCHTGPSLCGTYVL